MNKKVLFLILIAMLLLPVAALAAPTDLGSAVNTLKTLAITISASVVIIGWVIAGVLYLTAAGSPEKIGVAKKALIAAIIGTIVVILAPTAFNVVDSALSGGGGGAHVPDPNSGE
jgi:hypothetical protein